MPDLADVNFSDDNTVDGGDGFSDIDDTTSDMHELQQQIAKQEDRLDTMNIKQEATMGDDGDFGGGDGGAGGDNMGNEDSSFLDRPYTITKNSATDGGQDDDDDSAAGTSTEVCIFVFLYSFFFDCKT